MELVARSVVNSLKDLYIITMEDEKEKLENPVDDIQSLALRIDGYHMLFFFTTELKAVQWVKFLGNNIPTNSDRAELAIYQILEDEGFFDQIELGVQLIVDPVVRDEVLEYTSAVRLV